MRNLRSIGVTVTFPNLINGKQESESRYLASHSVILFSSRPDVCREPVKLYRDKLGKETRSPDFALFYFSRCYRSLEGTTISDFAVQCSVPYQD